MRKWKILVVDGRSREGAWIEIALLGLSDPAQRVAPARERGLKLRIWKGATMAVIVAPARERGLKLVIQIPALHHKAVAPARERGLKYKYCRPCKSSKWSLPRGSVD